jgi:type IV pilus assembly protein PilA
VCEVNGVNRVRTDEQGFTLIELMVVLLIMLILVGIAIPSFMGSRDSALNAKAKSVVREALPAVKAYIIGGDPLADIEVGIKDLTPTIAIDPAAVEGIAVALSTDGAVCVFRVSEAGGVYAVWEPSLTMGAGTLYAELAALPATCPTAADAGTAGFSATSW